MTDPATLPLPMATRRTYIALLILQWRRRYAQRRLVRELGWRPAWQRVSN